MGNTPWTSGPDFDVESHLVPSPFELFHSDRLLTKTETFLAEHVNSSFEQLPRTFGDRTTLIF